MAYFYYRKKKGSTTLKRIKRLFKSEMAFLFFFYAYIFCSILFTITEPRTYRNYTESLVHLNLHNYPMQMIAGAGLIMSIITTLSYRSHKKMGLIQKNKDPLILLIAALLFISTAIFSSFVGYKPYIKPYIFVEFLLFLSVFFVKDYLDLPSFIHTIKKVLLLIIYGTFLFIIVNPLWSIELDYNQGMMSFFSARLYGLTTNSNYTAPLIMLYFIFEIEYPIKSKMRSVNLLLSLFFILFTQSKTIWILLLLYGLIKIVHKGFLNLKAKFNKRIILTYTTLLLIMSFVFLFVGYCNSYTTFTGRTIIWGYTIDAWQHNKVFGYGMGLWNEEMFLHYKDYIKEGWIFSHAHSQYYQTLGESGIVGIVFLFLYFFTLVFFGVKYAGQTKGLSYYFALFLIIRGWTEPVFRHFLIDFNFFIHFIIYTYFMLVAKKTSPDS